MLYDSELNVFLRCGLRDIGNHGISQLKIFL